MKHTLFKVLIVGAVAVGASMPMLAQTGNPWLEQWYRAKFGRPSPAATTQQDSTRCAGPSTAATATTTTTAPADSWFENWYRDKFGRPSPLEQANPQQPVKLFKADNQKQQRPVNTWFEQWYRDKYGRPSPEEEGRLNPRNP